MNRLQGKVALVTGGNSGIGLATAQLFAQEGAQVIITGRDQATLDQAAELIGPGTLAVKSDVSRLSDLDALFAQVQDRVGKLDILFANAGIFKPTPLAQITEALYDELFDINVKGLFFTVQKAVPLLREGGSIILNASSVTHVGTPALSLYAATKAAVRQLARNLSSDLAEQRIRVNVVSPGLTQTALFQRLGYTQEQEAGALNHFTAEIPMRRVGQALEIAQAVLFLASDESSYMMGEELLVDGGYATLGIPGVQR